MGALRPALGGRAALRLLLLAAALGASLLVPAATALARSPLLKPTFVHWTKLLQSDYRTLNRTWAEILNALDEENAAEVETNARLLVAHAQAIVGHARAARKAIRNANALFATSAMIDAQNGFRSLKKSGRLWVEVGRCLQAWVDDLEALRCSLDRDADDFIDEFVRMVGEAKRLSAAGGKNLRRANEKLGKPLPSKSITKATKTGGGTPQLDEIAPPGVPNLAGEWLGQDGGRYTITQVAGSRSVSWSACDSNGGTLWSHTFTGKISGNHLVGTFVDGPPGNLRNSGTLVLAIQGTGSLSWVASATIDGKTYTSFPTLTRQWSRGGHGGCPGLGSGFAITSVSLPATITGGGPTGNLAVSWTGNPTFPVTVVYTPDACPPGWGCSTPTMTFATHANPLVFPGAVWCTRVSGPPVFFDYSVYLVDANGKRTQKANADFTCEPS